MTTETDCIECRLIGSANCSEHCGAEDAIALRDGRDGCGCLPAVTACRHFDGHVLALAVREGSIGHAPMCPKLARMGTYTVTSFSEDSIRVPCPDCGVGQFIRGTGPALYVGFSETAALAAFALAEARLLGRADE